MNNKLPQQVIAVIAVIVLGVALYIGTYLPYKKSSGYLTALGRSRAATSLEEFGVAFSEALDRHSPVGQEELVRNFAANVAGVIEGNARQQPEIASVSLALFDHYADPILNRGKGLSFVQTLLVAGNVYEQAYQATGNEAYSDRARAYFLRGLELSPDRPQLLYALVLDHQARGETAKAKEYANRILSIWPDDAYIRTVMGEALTVPSTQ